MANLNTHADRINMLIRFYRPAMRAQLIAAGFVVAACYLVCLGALSILRGDQEHCLPIGVLLYAGARSLAGMTFYCGPLLFAFCRNRAVATTLPASWQEKAFFFLAYILLAYPAFLAVVWYALLGLASIFTADAAVNTTFMEFLQNYGDGTQFNLSDLSNQSWYTNVGTSLVVMSCVAFAVVFSRRNRVALGIVGGLVGIFINFAAGLVIGIASVASTDFMRGLRDGLVSAPNAFADQMMQNILYDARIFAIGTFVLSAILLALCVWKIKTRQN